MKTPLLLAITAAASLAHAQIGEPESTVRRAFPLEAARVLATQRHLKGEVTATPGDGTAWKIEWRDAEGKIARERSISGSIARGATYFREVFRQLAGDDWLPSGTPPDNAPSAYWQGADLAGSNRSEALTIIAKLLADLPDVDRAADAARIAGAHIAAATPSEKDALDPALLARGAAWLATAEARLREPIDAAWAPVLFLTGERNEAAALWKTAAPRKLRTAAENSWNIALGGAPQKTATTAPAPAPDFTDADKAWAYLQKLDQPPQNADSPEDKMRRVRLWLADRRSTAEKFRSTFPSDPRRWDAAIIAYEAAQTLQRTGARDAKLPSSDVLTAILDAPDASESTKGDAAFFRTMLVGDDITPGSPHTLPPFLLALSEYIAAHPRHPRAITAASIELQLLNATEIPGADQHLAKLIRHADPQIASEARAMIEHRARFAELKAKPVELKFTAADGREIDLARLRGKVVLLDFWASWCGPCVSDAPHVVATWQKLHERGFEIIGINLDDEKTAMEAAQKSTGMIWPQHHDGKGWQNEIAQRFGIRSIPATWLFDKKGKLREIGLRGQELEARIEHLLREK